MSKGKGVALFTRKSMSFHFREPIEYFHHKVGIGWYYKRFYLGECLEYIKNKPTWEKRLLRGRDIEVPTFIA